MSKLDAATAAATEALKAYYYPGQVADLNTPVKLIVDAVRPVIEAEATARERQRIIKRVTRTSGEPRPGDTHFEALVPLDLLDAS